MRIIFVCALEDLITLCAGCHTRIHRLMFNRFWMPTMLVHLWHERHLDGPVQLQLGLERAD